MWLLLLRKTDQQANVGNKTLSRLAFIFTLAAVLIRNPVAFRKTVDFIKRFSARFCPKLASCSA